MVGCPGGSPPKTRTRATWLLSSCTWYFRRPNVNIALAFCLLCSVRCAVVVRPTNTKNSVGAIFAVCSLPLDTDCQFPVTSLSGLLYSYRTYSLIRLRRLLCGSLSSSTGRGSRRRTPVRSLTRLRSRYKRELWTTGTPVVSSFAHYNILQDHVDACK